MIGTVHTADDFGILFVLLGLVCLVAAAYMAYLRNVVAAAALVFVGVLALILAP